MSLQEQLAQAKLGFVAKVPAEFQERVFQHIQEQRLERDRYGLGVGETAPNFTLLNPLGDQVTLHEELAQGPVVLTFYRGSWCPFCNLQLRAYEQALSAIQGAGGRLIAVTPQSPDNALTQLEKEQLTFPVLSDPEGRVSEAYKLLFELPEYLQHAFLAQAKLDLSVFNASTRWHLPVPGTFIIDQESIIRAADVNPDFMQRMEPADVIAHLKQLQG